MCSFSLEFTEGINSGKSFSFKKKLVSIGRKATKSEMVINDQSVSGLHAVIKWTDEHYCIADNNSKNGTLVNGQPIIAKKPFLLNDGDELLVGRVKILFREKTKVSKGNSSSDTLVDKFRLHAMPWVEKVKVLPRSKLIFYGLVGCICLIIAVVLLMDNTGGKSSVAEHQQKVQESSATSLSLPAKGPFLYADNLNSPTSLSFSFRGAAGQSKLLMFAENVDSEEVQVFVNDKDIGYLPVTFNGFEEIVVNIPPRLVLPDQENKLVLKSVLPTASWGVKDVSLEGIPEGVCDLVQGKKHFDLGSELYLEKLVNEHNLYLSVKNSSQAISFSATCTPLPDWYYDALQGHELAENELDNKYQNILFLSKKMTRIGQQKEAVTLLKSVFQMIPDENDQRVADVRELIEKIQKKK